MAGEKVATYSAEQTQVLVDGYSAGKAVEALALEVGKSVRSVIAKLSREGVYKSKAKADGKVRVTKAMLVAGIASKLDVSEDVVESLEKATHEALEAVYRSLSAE